MTAPEVRGEAADQLDPDDADLEAVDHNDELDPAATAVTRPAPLTRTDIETIL